MKVITGYLVIEQYDDGQREPFGMHGFEETPKIGDVVTLRWFDRTPAYDVKILVVNEDDFEVIVEAIKDTQR